MQRLVPERQTLRNRLSLGDPGTVNPRRASAAAGGPVLVDGGGRGPEGVQEGLHGASAGAGDGAGGPVCPCALLLLLSQEMLD